MPDQAVAPPQPVLSVTLDTPGARRSGPVAAGRSGRTSQRAFPAAAQKPLLQGPKGISFDFNDGCRIGIEDNGQLRRVRMGDIDTDNILFETQIKSGRVNSSKRYFVRFRIEVWEGEEKIFQHDYSAADREVLVQLPVGTLGDTLGWFPYAVRFKENHGCRLTVAMAEWLIPLFRDAHPDITFVNHEQVKPERYYATYNVGLFFDDKEGLLQPCDFRLVGLHRSAGYILGVDPSEIPPRLALADASRPIPERYVSIAAQSTTQAKYWNNPTGWREIVEFLKQHGYRVICIDQRAVHGTASCGTTFPTAPRTRRATSRCRSAPAGCATPISSWAFRADFHGLALGRRHPDRTDQRLHPPDQRILDALSRHQLSRLQQLLERPASALRSQGLPVVPAPEGHAPAVRVYATDHGRAGQGCNPPDPWLPGQHPSPRTLTNPAQCRLAPPALNAWSRRRR